MKKKIPTFKTDRDAERFVATSDLSRYDLSGAQFVHYEMKPKSKSINLRLSAPLLDAIRNTARRAAYLTSGSFG